jgi:hypothetical protein
MAIPIHFRLLNTLPLRAGSSVESNREEDRQTSNFQSHEIEQNNFRSPLGHISAYEQGNEQEKSRSKLSMEKSGERAADRMLVVVHDTQIQDETCKTQ